MTRATAKDLASAEAPGVRRGGRGAAEATDDDPALRGEIERAG